MKLIEDEASGWFRDTRSIGSFRLNRNARHVRIRINGRVMLNVGVFFGQQDENAIGADGFADRLGETIEKVLQRRDRFQDSGGLAHGGSEIDSARADEQAGPPATGKHRGPAPSQRP